MVLNWFTFHDSWLHHSTLQMTRNRRLYWCFLTCRLDKWTLLTPCPGGVPWAPLSRSVWAYHSRTVCSCSACGGRNSGCARLPSPPWSQTSGPWACWKPYPANGGPLHSPHLDQVFKYSLTKDRFWGLRTGVKIPLGKITLPTTPSKSEKNFSKISKLSLIE